MTEYYEETGETTIDEEKEAKADLYRKYGFQEWHWLVGESMTSQDAKEEMEQEL